MSFSFSIRVVNSDGDPRSSVRVAVSDPGPLGLGVKSEHTDDDGWTYFDWPEGSSAGLDVYVDGSMDGNHHFEEGETISLTVDP